MSMLLCSVASLLGLGLPAGGWVRGGGVFELTLNLA